MSLNELKWWIVVLTILTHIHILLCFEWSPITELETVENESIKCEREPYLYILYKNIEKQYKYIRSIWNEDIINQIQQYSLAKHLRREAFGKGTYAGRYDRTLFSVKFNQFNCKCKNLSFIKDSMNEKKITSNMVIISDICKRIKYFYKYLNSNANESITLLLHVADAAFYPLSKFPIFSTSNNLQKKEYNFLLPSRTYYFDQNISFISRMNNIRNKLNISWYNKISSAIFIGYPRAPYPLQCEYSCRGQLYLMSILYPHLISAKYTFQKKRRQHKSKYNLQFMADKYYDDYEQMKFKFIIICDGYSIADRYPRQLLYNSVIFKQNNSNFIAFWYLDLIPFVHYIPFNNVQQLKQYLNEYFTKQTIANLNNDNLAKIAQNGMNYILNKWTQNRMDCYIINSLHLYTSYFTKTHVQNQDLLIENEKKIEKYFNESIIDMFRSIPGKFEINNYVPRTEYICGQLQLNNISCYRDRSNEHLDEYDLKNLTTAISWVTNHPNGRKCKYALDSLSYPELNHSFIIYQITSSINITANETFKYNLKDIATNTISISIYYIYIMGIMTALFVVIIICKIKKQIMDIYMNK